MQTIIIRRDTDCIYDTSMMRLSPDIEKKIIKGEQTMNRMDDIWNGIATDQFIETIWMRKSPEA